MQQLKKLYPKSEITKKGDALELDLPFSDYEGKDTEIIDNIKKNSKYNIVNIATNYANKFIKVYCWHDPKYKPPEDEYSKLKTVEEKLDFIAKRLMGGR